MFTIQQISVNGRLMSHAYGVFKEFNEAKKKLNDAGFAETEWGSNVYLNNCGRKYQITDILARDL